MLMANDRGLAAIVVTLPALVHARRHSAIREPCKGLRRERRGSAIAKLSPAAGLSLVSEAVKAGRGRLHHSIRRQCRTELADFRGWSWSCRLHFSITIINSGCGLSACKALTLDHHKAAETGEAKVHLLQTLAEMQHEDAHR